MLNKFQKLIAEFLLASQILFWPALAFAQVATPAGSINAVSVNSSGSLVGNNEFNAAIAPFLATGAACDTVLKGFEATDDSTQLGFSFSSLIGGGGALAVQLGLEIAAYKTYILCKQGVITSLDGVVSPNSYTSGIKIQLITQINTSIQTYKDKLKTAQGRYNIANQDIWKALLITVLINTTKSVADQLVNKLVSNYKITNIKGYVDSLATLAYDNQYIRENFPDNAQAQLMTRAILTNPLYRSQIQPGIFTQASNALAYNPATLSPSDPNFYTNMANFGSTQANPYYLQSSYVVLADQSHSNAINTAQQHVAQGNGYKAPVNCAGSLAQQKSTDLQAKAMQDQIQNRQNLLTGLKTGGGSASDIAKAQSDLTTAQTAWNKAPDALGTTNPAVVICEAVSSPAVLVNQGIDAVFKSLNLGNYTNSNLPGFLSAISGIATQISSSLVLGGITGNSTTINENQAVSQVVNATTGAAFQTIVNNAQANVNSGIQFDTPLSTGAANQYWLNWSAQSSQLSTASYVTITGPGITGVTSHQPLVSGMPVTTTTGGNYLLTVYNSAGKALGTATTTLTVNPQQSYNYNSGAPAVAGAFTNKPVFAVRGPQAVFAPRGQ